MKMTSGSRAIDKIYKRRDRYEIPEWQRSEVWGNSKRQNLIDSILRDWKLPKFYFLKTSDDPEGFFLVDGQQRLSAIFDFFDNELALSESSAEEFGGEFYKDLPDTVSDKYDDFEIEYDLIEEASEEEVKKFFQRLQDGLPLTSSEKLNAVHSNLRDYVASLVKHPFFQKVVASDRRYGHFDIVAKVAAIEIDGIDVGLRYDDLLAVFESQAKFSASSNTGKRMKEAFDFLDRVFSTRDERLRNRTVVQSFATMAAVIVASGKSQGQEANLLTFLTSFMDELSRQVELGQAATDRDYLTFQRTVSANVKAGAHTRHQILLRKLLISCPAISAVLGPDAVAQSGLRQQATDDAVIIARLVERHNAEYSAQYGSDLFKPTNRTMAAMARIKEPIDSYEQYKTLLEDLYFIFHEGPGQRLSGKVPPSFSDVNVLRTGLEHDLDHGKSSESEKKRKMVGEVFKKYSGHVSPDTLDPQLFAMVQASLLSSIRRDLESLKP